MNNKEKYVELKELVLNRLINSNKENVVKSKKICEDLNISFRLLKAIVASLREEYPIVSRETNGGGYWMASSEMEILEFINMINIRKRGYEETVDKMNKHLMKGI